MTMLNALLRRKPKPSPLDAARIPDGVRVYAIGDVHGCAELLDQLLAAIDADHAGRPAAKRLIVFLGDLVDRGPDSAGVIERAMALKEELGDAVRFLAGNHEEVMLGAATGDEKLLRFFCRIGGRETILSYGLSREEYLELDVPQLAARMPSLIPQRHLDFLAAFEDRIVIGDYAFVHAGIRPGVPIDEQRPKDLRWIREEFILEEEPFEKIIVHGHTISERVNECPNRIGIDTGAYNSGVLTALALEGDRRWYLQTGG